MKNDIRLIRTSNVPMVDELVYWVKQLATTAILKNPTLVNKYETLESSRNGGLYLACVENRVGFDTFDYSYDDLIAVGIPHQLALECGLNKDLIPFKYRKVLVQNAQQKYLSNYVELNNYYRMLNGQPNLGADNVYLLPSMMNETLLERNIYQTTPIHMMTDAQVDYLYKIGIIDELLLINPDAKFLNYLGYKKIPLYRSRSAQDFSLLQCTQDGPSEVYNKFLDKLELNREYTMATVYNEAFKIGSDYYDNFILVFIIIQTMIDMFTTLPEMIIRREFFDIGTLELVFKCHDVDFFPEIPFRYQLSMVQNINTLIKYKSTTKNIVDICSLFGFNNIEVFNYFLLKKRKVDKEGNFIYPDETVEALETGKIKNTPDVKPEDLYELKFIKVPIEDICDNYIHDKNNYLDYDDITLSDAYWDGELPHEMVKQSILEHEFNYLQSKYMSIDTIYSLTELSFELTYFYNMIYDGNLVEEDLYMQVPSITPDVQFRFVDVISYLFALGYAYLDINDNLMDTPTKVLTVMGFNFSANLTDLSNYLYNKGLSLSDVGIENFQTPTEQIPTYKAMMRIFNTNMKIYKHIVYEMLNADNYHIYEIYKTIYDALMVTDLSMQFFKLSNGTIAKTWTQYIEDKDSVLYKSLMQIKAITNLKSRRETINNLVTNVVYTIQQYLDTKEFSFIWDVFPGVSAEAIKGYIYKVLNFFKSYKVDIFGMNSVYKFDDQLSNKIIIIDNILINYVYNKSDVIKTQSYLKNVLVATNPKDKIDIMEKLSIIVKNIVNKVFSDNIDLKEQISSIILSLSKKDTSGIVPYMKELCSEIDTKTLYFLRDMAKLVSTLELNDAIELIEYMDYTRGVSANIQTNDIIDLVHKLEIISLYKFEDKVEIYDKITIQ